MFIDTVFYIDLQLYNKIK